MLTKPARSLLHPETLIATWFGSGLLPYVPGTWGSLAALPFAWFIISAGGWALLLCAIAVVFCVGVWGAARYEEVSARKDPGEVVASASCPSTRPWMASAPAVGVASVLPRENTHGRRTASTGPVRTPRSSVDGLAPTSCP